MKKYERFCLIMLIASIVLHMPVYSARCAPKNLLEDIRFQAGSLVLSRHNQNIRDEQDRKLNFYKSMVEVEKASGLDETGTRSEHEKEVKFEHATGKSKAAHLPVLKKFIANCVPLPECLIDITLDYFKCFKLYEGNFALFPQDQIAIGCENPSRCRDLHEENLFFCDRYITNPGDWDKLYFAYCSAGQKIFMSYNVHSFSLFSMRDRTQKKYPLYFYRRELEFSPQGAYIKSLSKYNNEEQVHIIRLSDNKEICIYMGRMSVLKVNFVKKDSLLLLAVPGEVRTYNIDSLFSLYDTRIDWNSAEHFISKRFAEQIVTDIAESNKEDLALAATQFGKVFVYVWYASQKIINKEPAVKLDLTGKILENPKLSFTDSSDELVIGDIYQNTCIYNVARDKPIEHIAVPAVSLPKEWPEKDYSGYGITEGSLSLDSIVLTKENKVIRLIKSIPIDYRSPLDRLLEGSKRPLFYTAVLDRASKKASPIWQTPWRDKVQLTQSGLCIYKTDHYCFNERTKKAFRSDAISFARVEYCNYDIRQSQ